jgi:hypothetical protein
MTWKTVVGGGRVPAALIDADRQTALLESLAAGKLLLHDITDTPDEVGEESHLWIMRRDVV